MEKIHLLHLKNFPILEQLKIEEALLRKSTKSFCIISEGTPKSIVMGISSKPDELLDFDHIDPDTPIIKRFSGGGCVIVDDQTFFVTFIFSKDNLKIPIFPEPILRWSEDFYKNAFRLPEFALRENDYVIGNEKCGGNAQYIQKGRWLHHTSFLWDYHSENMRSLKFPKKVPNYREKRSHDDFLCKLKDHLIDKERFVKGIKIELSNRFRVHKTSLETTREFLESPHRKSTSLLNASM